ncbi:MAG: AAA family ATPase, partial [Alphaproteobacteria bacterium]|nr:AAA family ATPase [Alphaproteobacteria bacterium]
MELAIRMANDQKFETQLPSAGGVHSNEQVKGLSIRKLALASYRNYEQVRLEISDETDIVVITGHNGAGKTNILEAISLLTPGRGLRRCKTSEVDRISDQESSSGLQVNSPIQKTWAVSCKLDSMYGPVELGTGRDPDSEKRLVKINGALAKSQASLGEYISTVWLTPQMDRLF